MNDRTQKTANVLRFLTILITVASLIFNLWLYKENRELEQGKQALESTILQQVERIIEANKQIRIFEAKLKLAEQQVDSLLLVAGHHSSFRDSIMHEISYLQYIIDKLNSELDEGIAIPDMSDDEHLQFFLEWSTIE